MDCSCSSFKISLVEYVLKTFHPVNTLLFSKLNIYAFLRDAKDIAVSYFKPMNELIEFSLDTENGEKNYVLAQWYENQGHTAPAHTYYLRAAERTEDNLLAYSALIRASFCYKSQGSRDGTEKVLLENALNFLPQRPEAYYFLSLLYERKQEWQNAYTYANLGLQQEDVEPIIPEFQGNHLLIFQKAVAAWWWGKGIESMGLFHFLVNNYWNEMDDIHKNSVKDNITRLNGLNSKRKV